MGFDFYREEKMTTRKHTKYVHEGRFAAEVDVELVDTGDGWSPYISLQDAYKLDDVREALRRGDVSSAARLARVFALTPVAG